MDGYFICEGLTKRKENFLLKDVSFKLPAGTVLGVIGVNGCGKTTLLRTILGSYRIFSGEGDKGCISLNGKDSERDMKEYRKQLAFIMQETPFSNNIKSVEAGELYGRYYDGFSMEKYLRLLDEYEVPMKSVISKLSTGETLRQQLAFARSYDAWLYVMDEPAGNMDTSFRDYFYDEIRRIVSGGASVILSSHLVTELERIADNILWIRRKGDESFTEFYGSIDDLKDGYRIFEGDAADIEKLPETAVLGSRLRENHSEALISVKSGKLPQDTAGKLRYPDLQEIMFYVERGEKK